MISSVSLWIDEGQTYRFARQSTLGDWWQTLKNNPYSEAHMPVGMLAAWGGARLFGTTEWGLRAPNVIWLALAGVAMGLLGRRLRRPWLLLLFLLQPFLWNYVNEARPYALQICCGSWLLFLLVSWSDARQIHPGHAWAFAGVCLLGFGSSLLFGFALFGWAAALALAWTTRNDVETSQNQATSPSSQPPLPVQNSIRSSGSHPLPDGRRKLPKVMSSAWLPLGLSVLILAVLSVYFLGALQRGAGGAKLWQVGVSNLGFAGYELLGFAGLGPPRNELRELARVPGELVRTLVQPRYALGLGGLALAWTFILVLLWKRRREPVTQAAAAFLIVTAGSLMVASLVVHFPFWGRHLAPVLPGVVALSGLAVFPPAKEAGRRGHRVAAAWLLVALAISCATVRWSNAHQKDDYRSAVALARQSLALGLIVWWTGDIQECAEYYGLYNAGNALPEKLVLTPRLSKDDFKNLADPDVIILSKPDTYDGTGQVREQIRLRGYQRVGLLRAFGVWVRPDSRAADTLPAANPGGKGVP
jgi:hypothetical protein